MSSQEKDTKCTVKGYETKDCTFENCPVYYYKDCYDSAKERCQVSEHKGLIV
ncbi:MAG: hypothetical protein PHC63_07030 [Candidatus Bathyarchaeota archaeon]|jgi:hypothetical protein|nr:hypothetical protein [Candidatus Bathyarchaeota archaeon]